MNKILMIIIVISVLLTLATVLCKNLFFPSNNGSTIDDNIMTDNIFITNNTITTDDVLTTDYNLIAMGGESKVEFITPVSFFECDEELNLKLECYSSSCMPLAMKTFTVTDKEIPNIHLDYDQYENTDGIVALYEAMKDNQYDERITNIELISKRYILISTNIPGFEYVVIFCSSLYGDETQEKYDENMLEIVGGVSFNYLPLQGQFFDQDIFASIPENHWQIEGENIVTYVPYHLFDDHSLFYNYVFKHLGGLQRNHNLSHQIGHYYRIDGNITDFKEFYESLDMYEVIEENNKLTLIGDLHKRELSGIDREATPVKGKTILDFKEEDGQRFVAYSFEAD